MQHVRKPHVGALLQRAEDLPGDVAARVAVRFTELAESLRLLDVLVAGLPSLVTTLTGR